MNVVYYRVPAKQAIEQDDKIAGKGTVIGQSMLSVNGYNVTSFLIQLEGGTIIELRTELVQVVDDSLPADTSELLSEVNKLTTVNNEAVVVIEGLNGEIKSLLATVDMLSKQLAEEQGKPQAAPADAKEKK